MRKIEDRIIEAVTAGCDARLSSRDRIEAWPSLGVVHVYLHATCIARVYADHIVINSGGWRTNTTKSRLNAILREYCNTLIYQEAYSWYMAGSREALFTGKKNPLFKDGMSIPRIR